MLYERCTPMLPYNDIFTRIKFVSDLAGPLPRFGGGAAAR